MSDLIEQGLIKGFNFADTLDDIPEEKKLNSINFVKTSSTGFATKNDLDTKVDKVEGKGLSENDYTNEDKSKVDIIDIDGDGTKYLSDDGEYSIVEAGISEAPQDNKLYGRKNADWEEITADIPSRIQNEDNTNYVDTENAYVNLNITTTSYESIFRKRLTEFLVSFQSLDQPGQNYGNPKTEFRINPNGFYIDVMSDIEHPVDSPYGRYNFGEIGNSEDKVARIRDLQQIIDTIVGE